VNFTATTAGELFVGVNDGNFPDNTGPWTANITVRTVPPPFFSQADKRAFEQAGINWDLTAAGFAQMAEACQPFEPCVLFFEGLALTADAAAVGYDLLALEPPDPNFTVIDKPVFVSLSTTDGFDDEDDAISALLRNVAKQRAYIRAIITANNRAQGAVAAGNQEWFWKQTLAGKAYAFELARVMRREHHLLFPAQDQIDDSNFRPLTLTTTELNNYAANIAKNGFLQATIAMLQNAGFTPDEIASLRSFAASTIATRPFDSRDALVDTAVIAALDAARTHVAAFAADRNGDGKVDCADLQVVRASFGLSSKRLGLRSKGGC